MSDTSRLSLLKMEQQLSLLFNRPTLDRALTIVDEDRAHIDSVTTASGYKTRIIGSCQAARGKLQRQDIQVTSNVHQQIKQVTGICTCSEALNCAHVAALLLCWQNQETPPNGDHLERHTVSAETQAWLQSLEQEEIPAEAHNTSQFLLYVLNPSEARLSLFKARRMKDSNYTRPEALRLDFHRLSWGNVPPFFQANDLPILRLFLALQENLLLSYESSLQLRGEEGAQLLRMVLRTGRLHIDDASQTALRPGPSLPGQLHWQRDAKGRQHLNILPSAEHTKDFTVLPTWPLWYVDTTQHQAGPLQIDVPESLAHQLIAAPALDELDALLVRQRLSEIAAAHQIELPLPEASEPEHPAGKPTAILRLQTACFSQKQSTGTAQNPAVITLWFEYPGLPRTPGMENPPTLLRSERAGRSLTLKRDLDTERAIWRILQLHGLDSYQKRWPNNERIDARHDCLLPAEQDAAEWMRFLEYDAPALQHAGIQIEISDDFPYQLSEAEDWFVEVFEDEAGENNDWFDLDLGVVIEGKRVSLVEPIARLIAQRPKLLEELRLLADDKRLPLPLDEHHVLPVTAQRLRTWLGPLLEFASDETRPRMSRLHAGVLLDLEKLPGHFLGGAHLRELGQRLRTFSGIRQTLPAPGFKAVLRPYQQTGLNWLQFLRSYGFAGILADDMGLGKTIQTLAHLHLEKASGRANIPSLVVIPTSLIPNWCKEAQEFAPDLRILTLHGPERAARFAEIKNVDLIFTTYPLLVRDQEVLLAHEYHLLVLDEAQFIKNPKAQSHRVSRQLKARHRLSLTGTPLENNLGELWAQYNFLMPGLLGDVRRFAQAFRAPIEKHNDETRRQQLADRVRPFLLRRTKEQVLTELPPKTEIIRWVELDGAQRDLYESLRLAFDKKLRMALATRGIGQSQIMILDALLKLRQACCDPRLVKLTSTTAALQTSESAKLELLMEMLSELFAEGRRILLFSQFTSMLSLIEAELEARDMPYVKLTGQTKDRETPIQRFQNGEVPLFLISLKAGGTGLNLTAADSVIHYDPWWNPAAEEQASARAHRIGQDKPVFVYKLLTQGTVEEKILALQERKRGLADNLLEGAAIQQNLITAEDLDVLFQPIDSHL